MSSYPKLVIAGRPNVGKSALFNRICSRRIAIVNEAEGVTRDRLYADADFFGRPFCLVDTGGIDPQSTIPFSEEVRRQSQIAIEEGNVILLVVDARIGITQLDQMLARHLLRLKKPVYLAVNKIDNFAQENLLHPFYNLGIKKILGVSALQGFNIAELLEMLAEDLFAQTADTTPVQPPHNGTKVAVIGRPNVGKSTLMNHIIQEERCVVSPIAGTTRDSIDADIVFAEKNYRFIDTAGIRRKQAEHEVVDKFAAIRTKEAIERSDVCILMLDATIGFTLQDKKIANMIEEAGKGCFLIFNKWDLVKGFRMEHCKKAAQEMAAFLKHCPMLFISAKTGRNTNQIFQTIDQVYTAAHLKISTGQLNRFIMATMQKRLPPVIQGRRLRIYYLTQVGTHPPHFVLFINHADLMDHSYLRFLQNQLREQFQFNGVPLILKLRGKKPRQQGQSKTLPTIQPLGPLSKHLQHDDELLEECFDEAMEYNVADEESVKKTYKNENI